jgi:hypothetical protein
LPTRHLFLGSKFKWINQQHYDRLGELVVKFIQAEMLRVGLDVSNERFFSLCYYRSV